MLKNKLLSAMGGAPANYIEDVFSTYLYTGNGSTQTINNGIDLAGEGGLVWQKGRSGPQSTGNHYLFDTARGVRQTLSSNTTEFSYDRPDSLTAFTSTGFQLGTNSFQNGVDNQFASWTFRKQPKFFDVVTWTGDGVAGRQIAHNLGAAPGAIIVKCTSIARDWAVWQNTLSDGTYLKLNTTDSVITNTSFQVFGDSSGQTSTYFTVGKSGAGVNGLTNASGDTYVAYLFAHNAGGFGLTGTDNVISCGSFTTDASGNATVNLGYEPQWVMTKFAAQGSSSVSSGGWVIADNMRGFTVSGNNGLIANSADAEGSGFNEALTSTGFTKNFNSSTFGGATFIYIAIRRGPMKTPTSGTSVFLPSVKTDSENPQTVDTGFTVDMTWSKGNASSGTANPTVVDRLRGTTRTFEFNSLNADGTNANISDLVYSNGYTNKTFTGGGATGYGMAFARAPQFFDEVCYTGTSPTNQNLAHNLQAVPEMIISHNRVSGNNYVYSAALGPNFYLSVDSSMAANGPRSDFWGTPTASTFEVRNNVNNSGETFSAYLFASCPGVSKVGSFTGTGATQTINCGFTGGARFVLIKATSTTGNWYVWDSARGIVAGNDPYLMLNVAVPQVTDTDWVDTAASGFQLSNAGGNLANSNGVSYIFLAIA